jgi:photosystem II stability/assembly factor-like uncharacterized protein
MALTMNRTHSAGSGMHYRRLFKRLPLAVLLTGAALCVAANVVAQTQRAQGTRRILLSSPAQPQRVDRTKRSGRRQRRRGLASALFGALSDVHMLTMDSGVTLPDTSVSSADKKIAENPQWRLNWFLFQRTYPFETLPSKGRFFAFARAEGLHPQPLPQATPTPPIKEHWRSVGPTPISPKFPSMGSTGGRLTAIAISPADPQLVLVGSATGGIWRSTDGGNNFVPVSDDQVDLAVGSLTFAASNPSIVYAGMGDVAGGYMGTGVLKSTDGGASWSRVSDESLPAPGTIAKVVVDPTNPERVYVTQFSYRPGTGAGEVYASGFFLSEDGGKSWKKTQPGLPSDLMQHPSKPLTLYLAMATTFAASAPSAGVYKSTDGGRTWKAIFTPPYLNATDMKIAVTPDEPETVYVFTGGVPSSGVPEVTLHVSHDGGTSWAKLSDEVDVGQFGYNSHIAADPTDAKTLYLGTRDLYKSTDGGQNWVNLTRNWELVGGEFQFDPTAATSHTDQHVMAFSPANPRVIYIGTDGGLSRSSDGGETFESLNATLSTAQLNSITMHPTDAARSCGGSQDNGALVRSPSLQQWTEFISGDSGRCLMNPSDASVIYSSYIFGTIFRFKGNGSIFDGTIATEATFSEPSKEPRIAFYPAFAVNSSSGELYFGTWRLFVSADAGNLWDDPSDGKDLTNGFTQFGGDVLTCIGVGAADSGVIYTGSAQGRVMVSKNDGKNWKDITKGLPRRFITSITLDPADANKAYLTVSGFASGHVFKTVDGGSNWNNISQTLPNIPINAFLIDPLRRETFYVGTDVGVYRSIDEGQTWHRFNNGLPPVVVTGFSSQAAGTIQISTYGRGAYELMR